MTDPFPNKGERERLLAIARTGNMGAMVKALRESDPCPAMEQGTPLTCEFMRGHDGPHSFDDLNWLADMAFGPLPPQGRLGADRG